MSHSPTNGSEDAPRAEDSASVGPPVGQDSVAPPRRIPHLGHALVFISFTGLLLMCLSLCLRRWAERRGVCMAA